VQKLKYIHIFSICAKLLRNAEIYGLVLAPRLKKKRIPMNLETQFTTLGAKVPSFINILMPMLLPFISNLGPNNKPKKKNAKSWPLVFFALETPSLKEA
jgi:hypothetical protein